MSTPGSTNGTPFPGPRISPGTWREIGLVNAAIAGVLQRVMGTSEPPHIFTTLGRHRGLMRGWLRFASKLMPGGTLPRPDTELVILRVAHNTGCDYERRHHEHMAPSTGLSADEVAKVADGPGWTGWSPRRRALLRAADELHADGVIGDALWAELAAELAEHQLIELVMLVGHYEMLAMTLNSLRVQPDVIVRDEPPKIVRLAEARR
jgi:AhpD family alkylhydroperoxidase